MLLPETDCGFRDNDHIPRAKAGQEGSKQHLANDAARGKKSENLLNTTKKPSG